jgi:HD-like signal output (HDOD) protein
MEPIAMTDLNSIITTEIKSQIDADKLILPTLPELALKAREIAERKDVTIEKVADVVRFDTAISARLIKVANSPLMRARHAATDLTSAISRLGLNFSCNLITGLAMEQMFQATTELVDNALRSVWATSTAIAGRASIIAKNFTKLPPDEAAFAGLVHLIGALPILTFVEENLHSFSSAPKLDALIRELHPELGRKILDNWGFPRQITLVPEEYGQFNRSYNEQTDCVDVIMISTALHSSLGQTTYVTGDIPNWQDIPAFRLANIKTDETGHHSEDFDPLEEAFEFAIKTLQ